MVPFMGSRLYAADRAAILKLLAPWRDGLAPAHVICDLPSGRVDRGIDVQVCVPRFKTLPDGFEAYIARLQEAINLLRMVLALEPSMLHDLNEDKWFTNLWVSFRPISRDWIPCHLRVQMWSWDLSYESILDPHSCMASYIAELQWSQCQVPNDPRYATACNHLLARLAEADLLDQLEIPVKIYADIHPPQSELGILATQQFFTCLLRGAQVLRRAELSQDSTFPFIIGATTLRVNNLAIAPAITSVLQSLADVGFRFECGLFVVQPHLIQCSPVELQQYVGVLLAWSKNMYLKILCEQEAPNIHSRRHIELLRVVFQAIREHEGVARMWVSMGSSYVDTDVLAVIIHEILDTLVVRPIELLLEELPARSMGPTLLGSVKKWRLANPDKSLRPSALVMVPGDDSLEFTQMWIDSMDEIKCIFLNKADGEALPAPMIHGFLMKFPTLQRVTLKNVSIRSVDVFTNGPPLTTLNLSNFILGEQDSWKRFLQAMHDGSSILARTMHSLEISPSKAWQVDAEAADLLLKILATNHVIGFLSVSRLADASAVEHLKQHHGEILSAPLDIQHTDQLDLGSLAFISVLADSRGVVPAALTRFDGIVAKRILEFSASHTKRSVYAYSI